MIIKNNKKYTFVFFIEYFCFFYSNDKTEINAFKPTHTLITNKGIARKILQF